MSSSSWSSSYCHAHSSSQLFTTRKTTHTSLYSWSSLFLATTMFIAFHSQEDNDTHIIIFLVFFLLMCSHLFKAKKNTMHTSSSSQSSYYSCCAHSFSLFVIYILLLSLLLLTIRKRMMHVGLKVFKKQGICKKIFHFHKKIPIVALFCEITYYSPKK